MVARWIDRLTDDRHTDIWVCTYSPTIWAICIFHHSMSWILLSSFQVWSALERKPQPGLVGHGENRGCSTEAVRVILLPAFLIKLCSAREIIQGLTIQDPVFGCNPPILKLVLTILFSGALDLVSSCLSFPTAMTALWLFGRWCSFLLRQKSQGDPTHHFLRLVLSSDPPASTHQVQGWQAHTTTPSSSYSFQLEYSRWLFGR